MSLKHQVYDSIKAAHKPREINYWHASSIAKCPRSLYLQRLGVKPLNEVGSGKILRWSAGHLIEESIRPHLKTVYPNLLANIRFTNDELQLTGEFDGYDPDSKTLISVKSVSGHAFISRDNQVGLKEKVGTTTNASGKTVNNWGIKRDPYLHHQWQEHAYVVLLADPETRIDSLFDDLKIGDGEPWPVEHIEYLYISLDGLITDFKTPVSPLMLKRVSDKVKYLNACLEVSEAPLCQCSPGEEMYLETNQYCDYRTDSGCCNLSLIKKEMTV